MKTSPNSNQTLCVYYIPVYSQGQMLFSGYIIFPRLSIHTLFECIFEIQQRDQLKAKLSTKA